MFGPILKNLRKRRKMNQDELAEALGMSQSTIASWESEKRKPDIDQVVALSKLFGVSTDTLLGVIRTDGMTEEEREMWEYRESVRRDPERHYLFSLAKNAELEDVRKAVAIIDALTKVESDD